jgi:alkylation response protein AidB-like acyl-CoA dehydrogenase
MFADKEEYIKLRDEVRKFNLKEFASLASECDEKETFPFDVLKHAADLGYVGPHLPEQYGGMAITMPRLLYMRKTTGFRSDIIFR